MAELMHAEIVGELARRWSSISTKRKERMMEDLSYVSRVDGNKILFHPGSIFDGQRDTIAKFENYITKFMQKNSPGERIRQVPLQYRKQKESIHALIARLPDYEQKFQSISFGSDVAEQDENLMSYFLETNAYSRVASFQKGIVIGPKGSGKSSILRALVSQHPTSHAIVITPEVFATSMLRRILEEGAGESWEEERAFVATWEFTILLEVFKHISNNRKHISLNAVLEINKFLRSQSDYADVDIFSRFILYLQRIQTIKLGKAEISLKTRQLQELFSLEPLYAVILRVRHHLKHRVMILIDELDQGWDNSDHSNRFLAGLLQAAVQIQNLGIQAKVVVLVRSEIFDLVRSKLAQLDKLRSSIERLKWSDGEIMGMVARRLAFHFGPGFSMFEPRELLGLLFESVRGIAGFDYIISRTTRRPREVLQFVRLAHQNAVEAGEAVVGERAILRAEEEFSTWKVEHVAAEYLHIYPRLETFLRSFRGLQIRVTRSEIEEIILRLQADGTLDEPWFMDDKQDLVELLYQVEFVGAPRSSRTKGAFRELGEFEFSYEAAFPNLKFVEEFLFHPSVWTALELVV